LVPDHPDRDSVLEFSQDLDREAAEIERRMSAMKSTGLDELAKELDGMAGQEDPSLASIEKELEEIEALEELDQALERAKSGIRGNEDSLEHIHNREPDRGMDEDKKKDRGVEQDRSWGRCGGMGFEH
jgi:hypothetical protein